MNEDNLIIMIPKHNLGEINIDFLLVRKVLYKIGIAIRTYVCYSIFTGRFYSV